MSSWIFQYNLNQYDMPAALGELTEINYMVRQHRDEIHRGDKVYLWESGQSAAIIAAATVMTEPALLAEGQQERPFWKLPDLEMEKLEKPELRVRLHVDKVLQERIFKTTLQQHPVLKSLSILAQPNATNFEVTDLQAEVLAALVATDPTPASDEWTSGGGSIIERLENARGKSTFSDDTIAAPSMSATRETVIKAMEEFDRNLRSVAYPEGWKGWTSRDNHKYAIRYNNELYPVKKIYAMATGQEVSEFVTTPARNQLTRLNFEIILLPDATTIWPEQVDGPCFVLLHQRESENQRYGETYSFDPTNVSGRKELKEALQAQSAGAAPVYIIIYLPGTHSISGKPHKAFTGWARVKDWEPVTEADDTVRTVMRLEFHEFPLPLYIKGNASGLVDKLAWLRNDLSRTFWQHPIRKISDSDFNLIIEEAQQQASHNMALADAAYAVLYEAGTALAVSEIIEQIVRQGWRAGPPMATEVANALLEDSDRFNQAGEKWDLMERAPEPALPDAFNTLMEYWDFVDTLSTGQDYTAEELLSLARNASEEISAESFVVGLQQLRLLRFNPAINRYRLQPYATSDGDDFNPQAILRLMVLGLLLPERTDEKFALAAREILPRLKTAALRQPYASFAPELKWENEKLLGWYAEAELVYYDQTQGEWEASSDGLAELPGNAPATLAYNSLLRALLKTYIEQAAVQAESFGPLAQVNDLAAKLAELQETVLVDDQTVQRIYRSLLAGRHVILSGPPGTGKTLLAEKLPEILWREQRQTSLPGTVLDGELVLEQSEEIKGYKAVIVTATEDWGVRDVIGGISPTLGANDGKMSYEIRYGALTGAVLKNYQFTEDGKKLPADVANPQRGYLAEGTNRYRGAWLVIDEFNRAHIDAAFGSLLTTLSGKADATLAVPARGSDINVLKMPADFRIIGTLNSFDRHFLNQISEALKRRFDFIDVLPPTPQHYGREMGISIRRALKRLSDNGLQQVELRGENHYFWPGQFEMRPGELEPTYQNDQARQALTDFSRIFTVIRFFRKLGTAQVEAVLANLFTGVHIGWEWPPALDLALADTLADQLQVLTPDEQQILESYLLYASSPTDFFNAVRQHLPAQRSRRSRVVSLLREADTLHRGTSDIDIQNEKHPTEEQLQRLFEPGSGLGIGASGNFLRRLRELNTDRGI